MKNNNCIFCQIAQKKIPAEIIYEDKNVLAFLDINPVSPGHTLIVSKKHYRDFASTPDKTAGHILKVARKIAPKILKAVKATDYNLITNNGVLAGQSVGHLHFHLIPRGKNLPRPSWETIKYQNGEIAQIAKRIKK